jgi:hypothetical protein
MADIPITEIGVGGAIAIIIIREFVSFVKHNKKNGNNVTKAEFEQHKKSVQYKDTCSEIVKRIDRGFGDVKEEFKEVKKLIRENSK